MRHVVFMLLLVLSLGACSPSGILGNLTGSQVGKVAQVVPDVIDETTELVQAVKPTDGTVKTSVRPRVRGNNNETQVITDTDKADDGSVITEKIVGDFVQNNGLPFWILIPIGSLLLLFWQLDNPQTILKKRREKRRNSIT